MKTESVYRSDAGRQAVLDKYDSLITDLALPVQQRYVETRFGKTHVIEAGDRTNDAIVLLHGSCSNSAMWFGDVLELAKHFRVLMVDIPGEPGRSDEVRLDPKTDEHALWLDQVLDGLGLEQVMLAGNSYGGWIAARLAALHPHRVSRLLLIAASGLSPVRPSFVFKSIAYTLQGQRGFLKINRLIYGTDDIPEDVLKVGQLVFDHFKPMLGSLPALSDEQLDRLDMPVLYMAGECDVTVAVRVSAGRLVAHAQKPETRLIPDCGHVIYNACGRYLPFLLGL